MPIRVRLALLFTLTALLLLTGGGVLFLRQLSLGLDASLDTTLRARADALASTVSAPNGQDLPDGPPSRLLRTSDTLAQVLGATGAVLESTDGLPVGPLLSAAQVATARTRPITLNRSVILSAGGALGVEAGQRAVRLLAAPAGGGVVVVVGRDRDVVDTAVERAGTQLVALGALVLVISAYGAWLLAGAALRPVERMRVQAAALGAVDAASGLAVPRTRDEVSRLAITINGLLGRLHAALARERSFVVDAGHELRTPLTILKGELELARRPGRTREQLRMTVEVAAEETDRLIRLAEDLLLLARAQEGPFLRRRLLDLREVGSAAVAASSARARLAGVGLQLAAPGPVTARVDPDRLRQALDNLLSNALRYAPCGTEVRVSVEHHEDQAVLKVLDHGPGFPPAFLPDAFERFRRSDTARSRYDEHPGSVEAGTGSGLGLAIVLSIARAHGGSAAAANDPAGGACVWLTVPAGDTEDLLAGS